jgi:NDP-sugar pyrophosphorylase family protein
MLYRPLTTEEREQLIRNGCESTNWDQIKVKEGFTPNQIHRVRFTGNIQLGIYKSENIFTEGIRDTGLHNCTIEDHVKIEKTSLISNYIVRSHAIIEYCQTITADDRSDFGNGTAVDVINEGGGRDVVIYEGLTAQVAWLMTFMQHNPGFTEQLKQIIREHINHSRVEKGIIGHRSRISKCCTIKNVKIGDHATLEGASHLNNGTIGSSDKAPTYIGHDVKAYDFIVAQSSTVDNGSILKKCFIGEGCIIDRQFSAENTVVFANSQLFNGEACSVFAAPYTVSHHKSTLMIAGYFSFINVGSGSNQSNHMYKLGPIHQGILKKGCKLGSDSYILWPAKVGPYTFITGRHYSNPDISNYPFSYLLDDEGTSQLVPGANLRSSGTIRDAIKWPQRDIRKGEKSDLISFNLFDPYVIGKALKGKQQLEEIQQQAKPDALYFLLGDVRIKKPALKRGIEVYNEAMLIYINNLIIDRCITNKWTPEQLIQAISETPKLEEQPDWIDLAGMTAPKQSIETLIESIEQGDVKNLSNLAKQLKSIYDNTETEEWQWAIGLSDKLTGIDLKANPRQTLITLLDNYQVAITRFYQMLIKDAQKEFTDRAKIGYGFDDDASTRKDDFATVRGSFEENSFVITMKDELALKLKKTERVKEIMNL